MSIRSYLAFFILGVGAHASAQTFSFTGADQSFTVPTGIHRLRVKLWGAGGGISGGSGAFVSGDLDVTPGQILTIVVGGAAGGIYYDPGPGGRTYGGGGYCTGISDVLAGVGGGRSAIRLDGVDLVTAGAGGGGTYVTIGAHARRGGGGGGILTGGNAEFGNATGGTQTAGGSPNGTQYRGGDRVGAGAGGGGGYFGGGGGTDPVPSLYWLNAAGGGSSFVANLSNVIAEAGRTGSSGQVLPGGALDSDYIAGIGVGGYAGLGGSGGYGRVVVSAAPVPEVGPILIVGFGVLILAFRSRFVFA